MIALGTNGNAVFIDILGNGRVNSARYGGGNLYAVCRADYLIGINRLPEGGKGYPVYKNVGSVGVGGIFNDGNKARFVCENNSIDVFRAFVIDRDKGGGILRGSLLNGYDVAAFPYRLNGRKIIEGAGEYLIGVGQGVKGVKVGQTVYGKV